MCNIAGYAGKRVAAPILLEMLRRQQDFDGGATAGISTIHEGRIYHRKIVGDVDTLIRHTDALYLPGNVGIAHTRPSASSHGYNFAHPFLTADETMSAMTNGTSPIPEYYSQVQEATDFLEARGYKFRGEAFGIKSNFPTLKNGSHISCVEARLNLVHYYYNHGMSMTAAMSKMASQCYTDSIFGALNIDTPDSLYILRTTRPAITLKSDDGVYVATSRFAFPDGTNGEISQLPVMYPARITADSITVSEDKMTGCEEISEVTNYTLEEGYRRISSLLVGKESAPLEYNDLEHAVNEDMRDIFESDHPLIQHARVVYDVIFRLYSEGKLKTVRKLDSEGRFRTYMWI